MTLTCRSHYSGTTSCPLPRTTTSIISLNCWVPFFTPPFPNTFKGSQGTINSTHQVSASLSIVLVTLKGGHKHDMQALSATRYTPLPQLSTQFDSQTSGNEHPLTFDFPPPPPSPPARLSSDIMYSPTPTLRVPINQHLSMVDKLQSPRNASFSGNHLRPTTPIVDDSTHTMARKPSTASFTSMDGGEEREQRLIVVSNRLPVTISKDPKTGEYSFKMSSGGLVSALSGCKKTMSFTWIGWPGQDVSDFLSLLPTRPS